MGAVRVLFDPNPAPEGGHPPTVVRGRLRLAAEGPRKTLVTREPQPAELVFRSGASRHGSRWLGS
jgi:hypothetical protein